MVSAHPPAARALSRVEDARVECDPTFPIDAKFLEWGLLSSIWEPILSTETLRGGVWLGSRQPHAFTHDHQNVMAPIAALLATAIEHWLIRDAERRRLERLEEVESLLGTITVSLDVRDVLEQLLTVAQRIVPHHLSGVSEIDDRARTGRVIASAGEPDLRAPTRRYSLTEEELAARLDVEIVQDVQAEIAPDTDRSRFILSLGLRSWLRVPLLLSGEVKGTLSFLHREPSRYGRQDAEIARRLADRIALVIAHRRLAEEARVAEETKARAERLEARVETLARELEARGMGRMVGVSPSWKETLRQVGRVAPSDTTVLITGESGTGKEVIASLIHQGSRRAGKPFVAINCAALPEQLLESELFGHEKGAFTGAIATKIGRIEQAEGGTLFLDEIAEMNPLLQAKLLRVLEQREFQRVGGTRTLRGRREGDRGHQPRPGCQHRARGVSRGPVLPAQRLRDPDRGAARAARRHSAAGRGVSRGPRPDDGPAGGGVFPGRVRVAGLAPVAGERARAAQRDRAGDPAV